MKILPYLSRLKLSPNLNFTICNTNITSISLRLPFPFPFPFQTLLLLFKTNTPRSTTSFSLSATFKIHSSAKAFDNYDEEESYREVNKIIESRALPNGRDIDTMDKDSQIAFCSYRSLALSSALSYWPRRAQMSTTWITAAD
ncbi:signal recognition particle 43 kDa protein [Abeliophyllum distichum]|uniref:Signal recognition particle 43 kDa protein n=1 Tax=Abeliophyllum distichum TaxID=126358 RepID=A0ABD1QXL4_9LAMI